MKEKKDEKKKFNWKKIAVISVLALFVVSMFAVMIFSDKDEGPTIQEYIDNLDELPNGELVKCMNEQGIKIFISKYCSHCNDQKAEIGNAFWSLDYVDCSENLETCRASEIKSVPNWMIDGEQVPGFKTIEELKTLTGC